MRKKLGWGLVLLVVVLLIPGTGMAKESPQEAVDSYVQKVLQTFRQYEGTELDTPEKRKEFKEKLSCIAGEVFDYRIMARMSLGQYWRDFSGEQQQEFVQLFRRLIETNYFNKLLENMKEVKAYSRDTIVLTDQIVFSSSKAEVRSYIRLQEKKIPVNYRLLSRSGEKWGVYDVRVEGVSLIQNYRSQFRDILNQKSPQELLEVLRRKVRKQKIGQPEKS
ncbi:MAG: ABC transporter substrate-binding protein [Desulfohalobiaceae bacterium]|nr:ABC transporter substrate-binding protein [Desulfohalobiaceae bacterium]